MRHHAFLTPGSVDVAVRTGRVHRTDDRCQARASGSKPHGNRAHIPNDARRFAIGWGERFAGSPVLVASLLSRGVAALQRLSRGRRRRQEIEQLQSYGPALLKDVGVSRADIVHEGRRSLWTLGREGSGW